MKSTQLTNKNQYIIVYVPKEQPVEAYGTWQVEEFETIEEAFIRSIQLSKNDQVHKITKQVSLTVEAK